jgi:hypothetical protein
VTVGEIVLGAAHVTVKKYSHSLLQGGNPSKLDWLKDNLQNDKLAISRGREMLFKFFRDEKKGFLLIIMGMGKLAK